MEKKIVNSYPICFLFYICVQIFNKIERVIKIFLGGYGPLKGEELVTVAESDTTP